MLDPNSDLINHIDVNSTSECALHIKLAQHQHEQRREILRILIFQTCVTMLILISVVFIGLQLSRIQLETKEPSTQLPSAPASQAVPAEPPGYQYAL